MTMTHVMAYHVHISATKADMAAVWVVLCLCLLVVAGGCGRSVGDRSVSSRSGFGVSSQRLEVPVIKSFAVVAWAWWNRGVVGTAALMASAKGTLLPLCSCFPLGVSSSADDEPNRGRFFETTTKEGWRKGQAALLLFWALTAMMSSASCVGFDKTTEREHGSGSSSVRSKSMSPPSSCPLLCPFSGAIPALLQVPQEPSCLSGPRAGHVFRDTSPSLSTSLFGMH